MTRREFFTKFLGATTLAATAPTWQWSKLWAWLHPIKHTGWKTFYKPMALNKWFAARMLEGMEKETVFYKLGKRVKLPVADSHVISFEKYCGMQL